MQSGEILQTAGKEVSELYILEKGIIEVYMEIENEEFVIERLFKGSVINFETFFKSSLNKNNSGTPKNKALVSMRFIQQGVIKVLTHQRMEELASMNKDLMEIFNKYKLKRFK